MSVIPDKKDPTLLAVDAAMELGDVKEPRGYLGASVLGNSCDRALWYAFRWARESRLSAKSLKAIADGHYGESVMAERLRSIPEVSLWTIDQETGDQIGFEDLNGHLCGHLDGIIQGLLQSPKTLHVWEHKQVNEKKFNQLKKLATIDEKQALEQWDATYFIQAQLYMHYLELPRHYLTCSTPGGREQTSCRTAYQPKIAKWAIDRAKRIIQAPRLPLKFSDNPDYFECRWCNYAPICHGKEIAAIHCRTCAHSTAKLEGSPWICEWHRCDLSVSHQKSGCPSHLIHPDLLSHHAEAIDGDAEAGTITYRMRETGREFKNGHRPSPDAKVFSSHEIRVAAAGCRDLIANEAWYDATVADKALSALRVQFDAEIQSVQPVETA